MLTERGRDNPNWVILDVPLAQLREAHPHCLKKTIIVAGDDTALSLCGGQVTLSLNAPDWTLLIFTGPGPDCEDGNVYFVVKFTSWWLYRLFCGLVPVTDDNEKLIIYWTLIIRYNVCHRPEWRWFSTSTFDHIKVEM